MARSHSRSPRLSISKSTARVRVRVRARARSPSLQRNKGSASSTTGTDQSVEFLSKSEEIYHHGGDQNGRLEAGGKKVMVVVDFSLDTEGAIEWALSHAVQNHDTILLLCVANFSKSGKLNMRAYEKLYSMKNACQMRRPEVEVELVVVEGKEKENEKGAIIVEEAKKQKVSVLVLGQRKKSMVWRLMKMRWSRKKAVGGIVEYCIQNASSFITIGVRRNSTKLGGYLITTKLHKNFWVLA